jgi:hypothetical protein
MLLNVGPLQESLQISPNHIISLHSMLLNVGTLKPHDLVRSEIPSKNLFSDRKFHLATATYTAGSSATSFVSDLTGKAWHLNAYLGGNQAKIEIYLGNTLKTPIPRLNRSTL